MHKLLVAVDGSEHARRALDYALTLAKENGRSELHIVTVQPEPNVYEEIQVYVTEEPMAELQRQHSKDILSPALEAAAGRSRRLARRVQRAAATSGPLVLWQDTDADPH